MINNELECITKYGYKFIGSGRFTSAYLKDRTVYLKSKCKIKQAMANRIFPVSSYFPVINTTENKKFDYEMKYEPEFGIPTCIHRLNDYNAKLYFKLRSYHEHYKKLTVQDFRKHTVTALRKDTIDTICEAISACLLCIPPDTALTLDMSKSNVGVTHGGRLMLLDIFTYN